MISESKKNLVLNNNLKIYDKILKTVLSILYCIFMIMLCSNIIINSDNANHLLQAQDILNGNIFLSDWNLTGVTFYTTDLIYYEVAYLLAGMGYNSIYICIGLMLASVFLMGGVLTLIDVHSYRKLKFALYVLLVMIPCRNLFDICRVHGGAVFVSFLGYYLCYRFITTDNSKRRSLYLIFLYICFVMGTVGDLLSIVDGIIPTLILCMYRIIKKDKHRQKYIEVGVVSVCSIITGIIWDKLFFYIGKANKNAYIRQKLFIRSFDKLVNKFYIFCDGVLRISYADFYVRDNMLCDFAKIVCFLAISIGVVMVIYYIKKMIRTDIKDDISALLVFGICMSASSFIFSDMVVDVYGIRYCMLVPVALLIIVVRNVELLIKVFRNKTVIIYITLALSIVGGAGKIYQVSTCDLKDEDINNKEKLIYVLEEHDLTNGYASYWNASIITLLSNDRVKVRHIMKNDAGIQMYKWFNKNCWYDENSNFVMINETEQSEDGNDFGINEANIVDILGQPIERIEYCGYIVLKYDYDISTKLRKNI